jgi:hypothetical protein
VVIPASKALRIAKDLEAYRFLKQIDSVNLSSIALLQKQISLDSVNTNILNQKLLLQSQIIGALNDKSGLQQSVTDQYKSQVKTLKWERNGAILIAVGVIIKLIIK